MVLVAMRLVRVMPISLPRLVAVAGVIVFTIPLPLSPVLVAEVPLVGHVVGFSVVSVGARPTGMGLRFGGGLGTGGVSTGARRFWSERFPFPSMVLSLLMLLLLLV